MDIVWMTLGKVGMLLVFITAGYLLRRTKKLPEDAGKTLSVLTTTLFTPAYSIRNLSANLTLDKIGEKALVLLFGLGFVLGTIALAAFLARLITKDKTERKSFTYAFSIPNYGYFGYPVIEGVFGSAVLADVMIFALPLSIATNSYGYLLFVPNGKINWKKILLTPMILGIVIGVSLGLSGLKLPGLLSDAINGAANCMSPASMLLAGFVLGKFSLKKLLSGIRPYWVSAIRLVGIPLVVGAVLWLCGARGNWLMYPLLIAAMPLGLNLVVFPESQGLDASENAKMCCVSYLMAVLVLPIAFGILQKMAM